jgi:phosphoserine phosphatase
VKIIRPRFDVVCFDCDSTLSQIEGIDELARLAGCEAEIAELTNAAMDGQIALDDIYAKRLDRVRPDRAALTWLGERYTQEAVSGAKETIAILQRHGKTVCVVSGGLHPAVALFAETLNLKPSHIFAVNVHFDSTGAYQGFDTSSPLGRSDGKAVICRALVERHGSVAMVGDGVTDLAARAGGAYVVGFGGVVYRRAMEQGADRYVSTPDLTGTLDVLLTDQERNRS